MTDTLRVVEAAASDLGPDEKVRLVTRMLLSMTGMSTLELGAKLGLGRTAVYDRTQGRKPFTVAEVVAMAEIFGIDPAVFLTGPAALLRTNDGVVLKGKQPTTHRTTASPPGRYPNGRVVPRPAREDRSVLELLQGAAA